MTEPIPEVMPPAPEMRVGRLSSHVYEAVKDRLIAGEWAHGARLSVERLREEFGVSKQPVMEALRLLSADGLVEIIPQVGCEVATYSAREVVDFFEMFARFEGAIAAAAAARRSDQRIAALAEGAPAFETLPDIADPATRSRRYLQLNHDFHASIALMADSRVMAATSRRMWDLCDFLINTTGGDVPMAWATASRHAEHERIRLAIAAGDAVAARREMEQHILATVDLIAPA